MSAQGEMTRSWTAGWLERLALHRPELRAWAMYDWANSAMVTVIVTAVFPIYFIKVANDGFSEEVANTRYTIATSLGLAVVAVLAPVLGAIADYAALKKKMLGTFLGIGLAATACMFFIRSGDWVLAAVLFVLANVGAAGSFVFYDSLLPHIAKEHEMDRLSTSAYALGYLGGGLLLALNLAWIMWPHLFGLPQNSDLPARLAFVSVAVWWLAFSIPLFRQVPEPARLLATGERVGQNPVKVAWARLRGTFRELREYRHAFLFLLGFLIYNDGIATIYRMATAYGTEIGIPSGALIAAVLMVQFIGIPFAILFGMLAGKVGAKPSVLVALVVYTVICVLGYVLYETKSVRQFFLLAILVAMVQGGSQALSRSLFASMIPKHKSSEFFGFFAVLEKFAGILGPAAWAVMIALTGTSQKAVLVIISFFLIGGTLLWFVDVDEGQRAAKAADAAMEAKAASG